MKASGGLDITSQPENVASLLVARHTRQPVVSAPFPLLQEQEEALAFMVRYPVFEPEGSLSNAPPLFKGAIAAAVRVSEMLDAVRASGALRRVALRLEDVGLREAPEPGPPRLLGQWGAVFDEESPTVQETLEVQGRRWRLTYGASEPLMSAAERALPVWMGAFGAAASLLLALAAGWLTRQRVRALIDVEKTQSALNDSEQKLRTIFHQAAVGVSLVETATGRFLNVNQKYCELTGYSHAELLQRDVQSLSSPEDQHVERMLQEELLRGDIASYRIETRRRRKDGSHIWIDLTVSAIREDGKPPGQNIGVIQDITERHQMRDALQRSADRQLAMLNHLPTGILLSSMESRIEYRNAAFVRITGYGEDAVFDFASWFQRAYPDPEARAKAQLQWRVLRDKAMAGSGFIEEREYLIRCADGRHRAVAISDVVMDNMEMILLDDLTERKEAEEEISYLASHDRLTGLVNRELLHVRLHDAMQRCSERRHCGAVLMLDLDHFKHLNETRGHDRGDEVLRQAAQRLRTFVRGRDTLARHGDDAFVLVFEGDAAGSDSMVREVSELGARILEAMARPFLLDGEPYHTSVSIGATVFGGRDESVQDLLQQVDMAMYHAKAAGRNTLRFFSSELQAQVQTRAQLERDLRVAIEQEQFELYYQPQVRDGRVIGAEALVRWHHPLNGFVSPAQFIPLAEESGLILPLGAWVLRAACERLALWGRDPVLGPLTLAVNISPRQFFHEDFVTRTLETIACAGAEPGRLELELTEGILLQDVEGTIEKMTHLKTHGVNFSLDDFGTGYSSLSYLKRLPLDQLKIDQGFVREVLIDPNDAAIARTIVALGTSLGLRVIAEGVETEEQRAFLERHGCNTWQGYLYSRPVAVQEFEALVRGAPPALLPAEQDVSPLQ